MKDVAQARDRGDARVRRATRRVAAAGVSVAALVAVLMPAGSATAAVPPADGPGTEDSLGAGGEPDGNLPEVPGWSPGTSDAPAGSAPVPAPTVTRPTRHHQAPAPTRSLQAPIEAPRRSSSGHSHARSGAS